MSSELQLQRYDVRNSPFLELQTPFTLRELLKMLLLIWLVPLRLLLGICAMLLIASASYVAAFKQDINKPLAQWRRNLVIIGSKLAGAILFALGVRAEVTGFKHYGQAKQMGAIGVFNHTSWIDAVILMWLFAPSGVALDFNATIPLVGTCIKAFQNIYVPRSSHGSAGKLAQTIPPQRKSVAGLIKDRAKDQRFPMLMMAPEGTCSDGRCILQFRSGCFLPGVPLLPVLLQYEKRFHNPAWTIINEGWHFIRLVCQFCVPVTVKILPPYKPSPEEQADHRLFSKNVRRLFGTELKVPLVDEGVAQFKALSNAGIRVSWDGRQALGPPGVIDKQGRADISMHAF